MRYNARGVPSECAPAWIDNAFPGVQCHGYFMLEEGACPRDDAWEGARAAIARRALTPRHLFRQLEPSTVFNGQTTSLSSSEAEKELVKEDLGGIGRGRMGEKRVVLREQGTDSSWWGSTRLQRSPGGWTSCLFKSMARRWLSCNGKLLCARTELEMWDDPVWSCIH